MSSNYYMELKIFTEGATPVIYTLGKTFFATATSEGSKHVSFQRQ